MDNNVFDLLAVNRDAVATNRGFYYQYLTLLKQWLSNFIFNKDVDLYTEVDEDIKEVGDDLIFTQIKCYTQTFSLNSNEIKNSIFSFFMHFLRHKDLVPGVQFVFQTNSSIGKNEKLLKKWMELQPITDAEPETFTSCIKRIEHILDNEINRRRNKMLSVQKLSKEKKEAINGAFLQLKTELSSSVINPFISKIAWKFSNQLPEQGISAILLDINILLSNEKFQKRPTSILINALLSEIYNCSQRSDENERVLRNSTIVRILQKTDDELNACVNSKLLFLFGTTLNNLQDEMKQLWREHDRLNLDLISLKQKTTTNIASYDIPKAITMLPFVDMHSIFGRQQCLNDIHRLLSERKNLSITGIKGIGKSTVAKSYIDNYKEEYDHIIWINSENNFEQNLILEETLFLNLKLIFDNNENIKHQSVAVYAALERLQGNNLIVIDNYDENFKTIEPLLSLKRWRVLLTTEKIIENIYSYKINKLDYDSASQLYRYYDANVEDESLTHIAAKTN